MGCCNSKNKIEDVNETAIRKIQVGENESSNRKVNIDNKKPVSNESDISVSSNNRQSRLRDKSDNEKLSQNKLVLSDSSKHNDSFGKQKERSKLSNNQIDESNNQSVKGSDNNHGQNETESSNGKLKSETKSEISLQNTNNSSDSESNEIYTITEQKSKSKGVSYIINVRPINKKKQTIKTKESKQSKYEAKFEIDISILFPKRKNDSKSSMDLSDELSISTENNEQTDKLKSKSSTKSDNAKLNESKVVLSDSSKDNLSQGKDDKTVRSQNNSSLSKQKEKSELSNKSLIVPDNGQVINQNDKANNKSVKGSDNENKSNTESEDDSSIEPQSDQEIRSNTKSNNRSIKGSDNEQGNKSTTELDINTPDINHSIQRSDNEEENEPNTESDDDSSIALESDQEVKSNTRSNNQSVKGSDNENGPTTESDDDSSVALENEPENRQNTDSDNQELSDNDDESLVTTHSPIFNRDQSLEEQVNEWKSLIETLTSNKKLMSYGLAKSRTQFKLVKDVGNYLAACREAKTVTEKAWLIYIWVTNNIAYDVVSLHKKDYRFGQPQDVLSRGLAVCAGYANIYKALCEHLGIECVKIGGYSKGAGYKVGVKVTEEDHAWNAIPIGSDGKLRFIESTWGAGHLFENKKFIKEFKPYYFAVPAHIFNETHHSESYTPTDGTKKFTLEEFDDCPNNQIGYHILGLTCVNNTMRAITRTNKNPLVIEYTAPQKIFFTTTLIEETTGREITDGIVIQSEYATSQDQKSRYCLIADIPVKGRKYKIELYAKNKRNSEGDDKSYPMITEFIVIREGDEENIIPRYNLNFDYDLRLTSHFSSYIKFKANPLVLEFEAPNNSQTPQKIYFSTKLLEEKTNREIKDGILKQSEYSMSKNQKSRYCFIADIPEKGKKYIFTLFAKNKRNSEDNDNSFPFFTKFILIREGDEESSIPRYNLTFDYDLRLTSHFSSYIKFKANPLVLEFEAPNNSQTPQKIYFSTKLLDLKSGLKIPNAAVVQCEYSMFKNQNSRYCLIADIPEKGRKYKLELFAKNKHSSEDSDSTFPILTEFIVIREGDEESYIPQYNLSFAHEIKLKSHYCQFIKFKTNPLVMEFEVPKHIKTSFDLVAMNDRKIEDAVFSQINPENSNTIVKVALPRKGEKFMLQLFAKHVRDQRDTLGFVSQFFLIRTQSNQNDSLTFCKLYKRGQDCFIFSPIEYYLTSYNVIYEFKYYIKDALDVAIVDSSEKWIKLDRLNEDPNVWFLKTALTTRGNLTLFAKFDENKSFDGICYYEVK